MMDAEQPETDSPQADGASLARGWLKSSAFVAHLGIAVDLMEPDQRRARDAVHGLPPHARRRHPWGRDQLAHRHRCGGSGMVRGAAVPDRPRASTVGITVDFLAPARGQGVTADARVVRRGGSGLCFCEVRVAGEDGTDVALALVTYQL